MMSKEKVLKETREKSPYETFTEMQIIEAFEVFDEDRKGKAKIKHLGTIVKALSRVPTQTNLQELVKEVEDVNDPGYFKLEKILPILTDILMKDEWKSASKQELIKAFKVLDTERKGFIDEHYFRKLLLEHGAQSTDGEQTETLDGSTKNINYKVYCEELVAPQVFDITESQRKIREKLADDRYRLC